MQKLLLLSRFHGHYSTPASGKRQEGQPALLRHVAHIGTDAGPGLMHRVVGTAVNAVEVTQANLLNGEENVACTDVG